MRPCLRCQRLQNPQVPPGNRRAVDAGPVKTVRGEDLPMARMSKTSRRRAKKHRLLLPTRDRKAAIETLLNARADGASLQEAAAAAGVHVATVCRWLKLQPELHQWMNEARKQARRLAISLKPRSRPQVPWRRDCPLCKARVVVRTAPGKLRFWRCGRWPWCSWASWRPRAPRNCRRCGSPCYWSHSRKSIGCGTCGMRIYPL
jgi:hypothetical protein